MTKEELIKYKEGLVLRKINPLLYYKAEINRFSSRYKIDYLLKEDMEKKTNTNEAIKYLDTTLISLIKEAAQNGINTRRIDVLVDYDYYKMRKQEEIEILEDVLLIQFKIFIATIYTGYSENLYNLKEFSPYFRVSYEKLKRSLDYRGYKIPELTFLDLIQEKAHYLDFNIEFPKIEEVIRVRKKGI